MLSFDIYSPKEMAKVAAIVIALASGAIFVSLVIFGSKQHRPSEIDPKVALKIPDGLLKEGQWSIAVSESYGEWNSNAPGSLDIYEGKVMVARCFFQVLDAQKNIRVTQCYNRPGDNRAFIDYGCDPIKDSGACDFFASRDITPEIYYRGNIIEYYREPNGFLPHAWTQVSLNELRGSHLPKDERWSAPDLAADFVFGDPPKPHQSDLDWKANGYDLLVVRSIGRRPIDPQDMKRPFVSFDVYDLSDAPVFVARCFVEGDDVTSCLQRPKEWRVFTGDSCVINADSSYDYGVNCGILGQPQVDVKYLSGNSVAEKNRYRQIVTEELTQGNDNLGGAWVRR
jgi:hypothetical protein